ncbi:MAG: glycosyltransferase family 2 protein [Pseudomonadota bacterium]|nr:glycosyltransferase family 2 protein [Pseudomonadota bacterium]
MSNGIGLSVVILTYNESKHIERCIKSLRPVASSIFIVDSFSTDDTRSICEKLGATVYQRKWKNYSEQFQWGLENCPIDTEWVMRMDADEYVESDLLAELPNALANANPDTSGFFIRRKYFFIGKWVKHGAVYPLNLLRVWRTGKGRIESRWMDEHIVLDDGGQTEMLSGHIVDDNLNNTKWWTDKHNKYADREMVDILGRKYNLFAADQTLEVDDSSSQAKIKRLVKEKLYNRIPLFVRPLLYFLYRYFIRLGFLDGKTGFAFHFFQGYWYRSLVDLRVLEAEKLFADKQCDTNDKKLEALAELTGLELK